MSGSEYFSACIKKNIKENYVREVLNNKSLTLLIANVYVLVLQVSTFIRNIKGLLKSFFPGPRKHLGLTLDNNIFRGKIYM